MRAMLPIGAALLAGCSYESSLGRSDEPEPIDAPAASSRRIYVKASNTGANDRYGTSLALSADGSTLVVGAWGEDSWATGIDGDQEDNTATDAGAVYVLARAGETWSQDAYVKGASGSPDDQFGVSVALSADGATLAVGTVHPTGGGTVLVYTRSGATWSRQAFLWPASSEQNDLFGTSVALSASGEILAVGAPEPSAAGTVHIFTRSGTTWSLQATVGALDPDLGDRFGASVALSAGGSILAVGTPFEDSASTGVDGDPSNDLAPCSGAVHVFASAGATWTQRAYVKASNTGTGDLYGSSVALSADGLTLAIGAPGERSAAAGIGGDQGDDSTPYAGAVYVLASSSATWTQQAYVKASNPDPGDHFGTSVALSADGSMLVAGARFEDSAAIGIDGDQTDDTAPGAGATYLFTRSGTTWNQRSYLKASNARESDWFGTSVALSSDGSTLAVGAEREASAAIGIDGDQADRSAPGAGAVYVFRRP